MPEHARTMPEERPDIARISTGRVRLLTALILLVFAGFTLHWLLIRGEDAPLRGDTFLLALAIGAAAQLVDGALGMAYGVTANSLLLALGLPPAAATATVHIAKAFTGAASGLSHWRLGNVDLRIFRRLVAPGILGGVLGAVLITTIDGRALRPWIAGYLLLMGLSILFRAFRTIRIAARPDGRLAPLARGARRPRSMLRGVLQAFQPLELSWFGGGEVKTLAKAEWLGGLPLLVGPGLLSGFYLNELLMKLLPREDAHPALFDAYGEALAALAGGAFEAAELRRFEKILLRELGYGLRLDHDVYGRPIEAQRSYRY